MDNSKVLSEIHYLQKRIERCYQLKDESELLRYLGKIKKLPITLDHLKYTRVEESVQNVRNFNEKIRGEAAELSNMWLEIKRLGDSEPDAISREIKWCKNRLKKFSELKDNQKLVYYLNKLTKLPIAVHHLQNSDVDITVSKLCDFQDDVGKIAESLHQKLTTIKLSGGESKDIGDLPTDNSNSKYDPILNEINLCKTQLGEYFELKDDQKMLYYIDKLSNLPIAAYHIENTNIDVTISKLCGLQDDIGKIARTLYRLLTLIGLFGDEVTNLEAPKRVRVDELDEPVCNKRVKTECKKITSRSKGCSVEYVPTKMAPQAKDVKLNTPNMVLHNTAGG